MRRKKRAWKICFLFLGALFSFWLLLGFFPPKDLLSETDFSKVIFDRNGNLLRIFLTADEKYRLKTSVTDLPPKVLEAILAYEDKYFWTHPGVNPFSLLRGFSSLFVGRKMGGSTLTMQTVRLAYHVRTKTIWGKLKQIFYALWVERHFSKAEILTAYFSLAPYGGNVEGLQAASLFYFHKNAQSLQQGEIEALMLVPQNPGARHPRSENNRLFEACKRQWADGGEYARLRFFASSDLPFEVPHLAQDFAQGEESFVETTIDLPTQKLLESGIQRYIERFSSYGIKNASAILLHWPTMEVRALVGSANFYDARISGQIDGTKARRSPGSTLKPFIYALALEQGLIHPQSILADTPKSFGGYDPENFDQRFQGPLHAEEALRLSRNVPAISLAQKLKDPGLYDFLKDCGVRFKESAEHYGLALVLGGAEVSMRELASLYALFPNRGILKKLRFRLDEKEDPGRSLLQPESAFVTLSMLVDKGEQKAATMGGSISLPLKTGTSNGFRDAWTCGIVGPYVLVVWIGNFSNAANPLFVGGRIAKPLYLELARMLAQREPMNDAALRAEASLNLERVKVCASTGDLLDICPQKNETWFIPGVSPIKPTGILRQIFINRETGLRACDSGDEGAEKVVWEFWPSDLAALFERAGRPKPPPPPYEEACARKEEGNPPSILSPKEGLIYYASHAQGGTATIALRARSWITGKVHWFKDGIYLGSCAANASLAQKFPIGRHHLMVVDEQSHARVTTLLVKAVP